MTSHILMFIFFIFMGFIAFLSPFFIDIPDEGLVFFRFFQITQLGFIVFSALNASDDLKKLLKKYNI